MCYILLQSSPTLLSFNSMVSSRLRARATHPRALTLWPTGLYTTLPMYSSHPWYFRTQNLRHEQWLPCSVQIQSESLHKFYIHSCNSYMYFLFCYFVGEVCFYDKNQVFNVRMLEISVNLGALASGKIWKGWNKNRSGWSQKWPGIRNCWCAMRSFAQKWKKN